ncbi:MAG: hypothetical protein HC836_42555 [Richelia sp. RM2_1_2]|nr:hypothetical protein [Richelia sp. RM2_1_2]
MPTVKEVIKKRRSNTNDAKETAENLAALESRIQQLENIRQQLLHHPKSSPNLIEQLNQLILPKLLDLIIREKQAWEKLWKRFSRDTINIGVAGRARQGKSTFCKTSVDSVTNIFLLAIAWLVLACKAISITLLRIHTD